METSKLSPFICHDISTDFGGAIFTVQNMFNIINKRERFDKAHDSIIDINIIRKEFF